MTHTTHTLTNNGKPIGKALLTKLNETTFIIEAVKNRVTCSRMDQTGEQVVPWAKLPLIVRRHARAALAIA